MLFIMIFSMISNAFSQLMQAAQTQQGLNQARQTEAQSRKDNEEFLKKMDEQNKKRDEESQKLLKGLGDGETHHDTDEAAGRPSAGRENDGPSKAHRQLQCTNSIRGADGTRADVIAYIKAEQRNDGHQNSQKVGDAEAPINNKVADSISQLTAGVKPNKDEDGSGPERSQLRFTNSIRGYRKTSDSSVNVSVESRDVGRAGKTAAELSKALSYA